VTGKRRSRALNRLRAVPTADARWCASPSFPARGHPGRWTPPDRVNDCVMTDFRAIRPGSQAEPCPVVVMDGRAACRKPGSRRVEGFLGEVGRVNRAGARGAVAGSVGGAR
jgi:hypothetical protein